MVSINPLDKLVQALRTECAAQEEYSRALERTRDIRNAIAYDYGSKQRLVMQASDGRYFCVEGDMVSPITVVHDDTGTVSMDDRPPEPEPQHESTMR